MESELYAILPVDPTTTIIESPKGRMYLASRTRLRMYDDAPGGWNDAIDSEGKAWVVYDPTNTQQGFAHVIGHAPNITAVCGLIDEVENGGE